MNRYIKTCTAAFLLLVVMVGCTTDENVNLIQITASIGIKGQPFDTEERLYQQGDTLVYKFEVTSPNGIEKIEFSNYTGVGANKAAPVVLNKIENLEGTTWTLMDTIVNIQEDVRYSVYVQDKNRNYKSHQVNAFLDISRYLSISLFDGLSNGTSKTFINTESGRTFYIANTIGDPTAMDFGFAFMENKSNVLACLVSFDNYWMTGAYPSIVNNLNRPMQFKKSIQANINNVSVIKSRVKNAADLKTIFEQATFFNSVLPLLPDEKCAYNIKSRDVIAFKTFDGRYGLMQVTLVDAKSNSTANTQKITFAMFVEKNKTFLD